MQIEKEKRRFKVYLSRVPVIILSGLMLGLCLYIFIANVSVGYTMPMPFGIGAGVVLSGSMEPELSVNDLIIVRRADEYSVGDVVVYRSGGMSVVHRVVSADDKTVVTKGDANNIADTPVSPSDISGKVVASLPKGGHVVNFLRSLPGVILVLGAALLMLEISFRGERDKGEREVEKIRAEIARLRAEAEKDGGEENNRSDKE